MAASKKPVKKTTTKSTAKTTKASTSKKTASSAKKSSAAIKTPYTKSQIIQTLADNLAETTTLKKKDIVLVFEELTDLIQRHLDKKSGVGQFTFPNLCKIVVINKPATKARKGISPFTGEETVFKAKPARQVVKIRPLKKLKDMVA